MKKVHVFSTFFEKSGKLEKLLLAVHCCACDSCAAAMAGLAAAA
jgi:hypothetical protein